MCVGGLGESCGAPRAHQRDKIPARARALSYNNIEAPNGGPRGEIGFASVR